MARGFRHTLFLLLQAGLAVSGAAAMLMWPQPWPAVLVCVSGALTAWILCERAARGYLRNTLGRLGRAADDLGHGRLTGPPIEARPGGGTVLTVVLPALSEAGGPPAAVVPVGLERAGT